MNKWTYILGAVLVAGFAVLGFMEMLKAQTPYISSVSELKTAGDRQVQFIGKIIHESVKYDKDTDQLLFNLKDGNGSLLQVSYVGVKPSSFDSAETAVVKGMYLTDKFVADKVMVKCPSKYQGKKS